MLEQGVEVIEGVFPDNDIQEILSEIEGLPSIEGGGLRNAEKKLRSVQQLLESSRILELASSYLPGPASVVRSILFNKAAGAVEASNNWAVPWHQDRTVAVSKKFNLEGWGPWSVKDGIQHVQPALNVLEQMVTLRIHLDDITEDNGCLRVIPRSHINGILSQSDVKSKVAEHKSMACVGARGAVTVMRPHLLHCSDKIEGRGVRRVLHIEFSSFTLPDGVVWGGGVSGD